MKVYIAGPMTGYPEWNVPAFRAADAQLRAYDFEVVSPVDIDHGPGEFGSYPHAHYMKGDLRALVECDAIALLPEWYTSKGARCEVAVALTLGLYFIDALTGLPMEPPRSVTVLSGAAVLA